jgi:hypothetical protein
MEGQESSPEKGKKISKFVTRISNFVATLSNSVFPIKGIVKSCSVLRGGKSVFLNPSCHLSLTKLLLKLQILNLGSYFLKKKVGFIW